MYVYSFRNHPNLRSFAETTSECIDLCLFNVCSGLKAALDKWSYTPFTYSEGLDVSAPHVAVHLFRPHDCCKH